MDCFEGSDWPEVSVVIPVYNEEERLQGVLEAVQGQDYPPNRYEVIVVDNGSTDRSPDVAQSTRGVTLLFERENLGSPYSARNRGIETANGEVIVLLDSKCWPVEHWLRSGIETMIRENGDLLGGNVQFDYEGEVTPGKICDALNNLKMEEYVKERQVATTCNLFVRREVFEEKGLFPERVRSGGDLRWTGGAVRNGWRLIYGPQATVYYPARTLGSLLRKQFRVAKGQPEIWRKTKTDSILLSIIKHFVVPISFREVRNKIEDRGEKFMSDYFLSVWIVHYIIKFVMTSGRLYGLLSSHISKEAIE